MGTDIQEIAEGFWNAATERLRELKIYVQKRKAKESVKMAPLYIDILYEIDKILEGDK